jgi:hypothetical protein
LDEQTVGEATEPGSGAKILRGENALERYLADEKRRKENQVSDKLFELTLTNAFSSVMFRSAKSPIGQQRTLLFILESNCSSMFWPSVLSFEVPKELDVGSQFNPLKTKDMRHVLRSSAFTEFPNYGFLQGVVRKADEEEVDSEPDLPARAVNL